MTDEADMQPAGWAVFVTKPSAEDTAERYIAELGYEVFLPRFRKALRDARIRVAGRRLRSREPVIVRRPLFPRYGFVQVHYGIDASDIDATMRSSMCGVERLIRHPGSDRVVGQPKMLRASIVERIRIAAESGEFDDEELKPKPAIRTDLNPGSKVRLQSGMIATIINADEKGRVDYLTELLGGATGRLTREEAALLELVDG